MQNKLATGHGPQELNQRRNLNTIEIISYNLAQTESNNFCRPTIYG